MSITMLEPSYYSQFSCLAAECRNNCCQKWRILFSKKDYEKLRSKHLPGAIQEKLRQSTRRLDKPEGDYYAYMVLNETGDCSLLCDGLCQLQRDCGASYLPKVCKNYPREIWRVGDFFMRSCHNSCEAVHQHLLQQTNGLSLVRCAATSAEEQAARKQKILWQGHPLGGCYETVLITLLALMQNRAYTLGNRLLLVGMAVKDLDGIVQENRPQDVTAWMLKFGAMSTGNAAAGALEQLPANLVLGVNNCLRNLFGTKTTNTWANVWLKELPERLGAQMDRHAEDIETTLDLPRLERQRAHLDELLQQYPLYLENIVTNQMINTIFPFTMRGQPYDSFLGLCNNFATFRIAMIAYAGETGNLSDVIEGTVRVSRSLEHNRSVSQGLVQELHETGADTLAHMAYLLSI